MSGRYLQPNSTYTNSRTASPRSQSEGTPDYTQRSSMSSDSSSSSASSSYSYHYDPTSRYSSDSPQPHVELLRCSRCAKSVEMVASGRGNDDAGASGMVRFGHNLYYCDRCAKMVGYKWVRVKSQSKNKTASHSGIIGVDTYQSRYTNTNTRHILPVTLRCNALTATRSNGNSQDRFHSAWHHGQVSDVCGKSSATRTIDIKSGTRNNYQNGT